jgi:hypothetical protein
MWFGGSEKVLDFMRNYIQVWENIWRGGEKSGTM